MDDIAIKRFKFAQEYGNFLFEHGFTYEQVMKMTLREISIEYFRITGIAVAPPT